MLSTFLPELLLENRTFQKLYPLQAHSLHFLPLLQARFPNGNDASDAQRPLADQRTCCCPVPRTFASDLPDANFDHDRCPISSAISNDLFDVRRAFGYGFLNANDFDCGPNSDAMGGHNTAHHHHGHDLAIHFDHSDDLLCP